MGMKYVAGVNYIAENAASFNFAEFYYQNMELVKMGKPPLEERPPALNGVDISILRYLAQYADDKGKHIYPTIQTICLHTLWSERKVYDSLKKLKSKKLVMVHTGKGHHPSQYELTFPTYCFKKPNSNFRVLDNKIYKSHFEQLTDGSLWMDDPMWSVVTNG